MRPLIFGNGSLLVCVDERGIVRDFYYPYAGMENHGGFMRLGLYDLARKRFAWLEDWDKSQSYVREAPDLSGSAYDVSMVGETDYFSPDFGAEVAVRSMVHHERNFFLRTVTVKNTSGEPSRLRLFSSQSYHILENNFANTAVRDGPMLNHYKRDRFFIQSSRPVFDQFTTGISEWRDRQGTWKDAEDGVLEGNIVAHGTVDSTVGWTLPELPQGESAVVHFWVCVGRHFREAKEVHDWVRSRDLDSLYRESSRYWKSFSVKAQSHGHLSSYSSLPDDVRDAFSRSLLTVFCHIDRGGSIIASCDSQIKQQGADYYTYCWPRDAAWVAMALDRAGYRYLCRNTYKFFSKILDRRGFFRHKYTPAGDLGSTWHPLPMVQIDETGLPLYALYRHWLEDRNIMTISALYEPLVRPAADFLVSFIDPGTGLPQPSFDLWEERKGVYAYSCACVYAGLRSAAEMASLIGDEGARARWDSAAASVRDATIRRMYDPALGRFRRGVGDDTVDASLFAVWYLGLVPPDHPAASGTMKAVEDRLTRPDGGIARYEGDQYQGFMNSWPLCTLWLAQWYLCRGDLERGMSLIRWAISHSAKGGLMPEQVNERGEPVSVLPLAWSHSTFMTAVIEYLEAQAGRFWSPF
ncbi:glycoside hydrolase family 15 protein [Methanocella arvoryzae]|nr:glycoside hydrolase family 15 protein [Methanocella arvoryzae]